MRALALLAICLAAASPAAAQAAPRDVAAAAHSQAYEGDLSALSEVLGSAHYLRVLCKGRSDQFWRERMRAFMDLEAPQGTPRRAMMSQAFNVGYRGQEERFSQCSPAAQDAESELKAKGARLTQALAARYRD